MQRLDRITLVRKGRATPKHPELRTGVVEVVKSMDDWYQAFADFISECPEDEIPEDWCEAFSASQATEASPAAAGASVEKAKSKNYPDTEGPFAGPHNSFPIRNQSDVSDAARLIGHAANPATVKARIIAIAHSKGYSLPKSWQSKTTVKKSEFLAGLRSFLLGEDSGVVVEDDESVSDTHTEGAPPATPASAAAAGASVEKAANPTHDHSHAHLSSYGYSYSHSHDHNHRDGVTPNSDNHDSSETAHAHVHVSKAGDPVSPEFDGLMADIKGLSERLGQITALYESEGKKVTDLEAQLTEVTKARDEAVAKSEAAESEKTQAVEKASAQEAKVTQLEAQLREAGRQPLTAGPVSEVEKAAAPKITKDMNYDDAFNALMGRQTPLPTR